MNDPNPMGAAVNQKKGDAAAEVRDHRARGGGDPHRHAESGRGAADIQDEADPIWRPVPATPTVPVELLQANETAPMRLKLLKEGHTTSRMFPWLVTSAILPSSQQEPLLKIVDSPLTVRVPVFRMSWVLCT